MLVLCIYLNTSTNQINDKAGIAINIAMFVIVFLIFGYAIVVCFNRVDRISQELEAATDKIKKDYATDNRLLWDKYKQDDESGLFHGSQLYNAYREYIDEMNRLEVLSPTGYRCSIEDYINQDLIDSNAHKNLLNLVPGTMTGMGILGTFIGLSFGLQNFNTGTSSEIEKSIAPLMNGIKVAFHTSIYGMVFSLMFNFVYRNVLEDAYESLNHFINAFSKYVCPDNTNDGLSKMIDAQQRQSEAVINPMLEAVQSMNNILTDILNLHKEQYSEIQILPEVITESIGKEVSDIVTPQFTRTNESLEAFANKISENQLSGMNELINNFVSQMNVSLSDSFANLAKIIENTCNLQKENSDYMQDILSKVGNMTTDIQQINELSEKTIEKMSGYVQEVENLQSIINQSMVSLNLQMDQNNKIEEKQQEYIATLVEYESQIEKASTQLSKDMSAQVEKLNDLSDDFNKHMSGQIEMLTKQALAHNSSIAEAARQEIQSISKMANSTSGEMERAAQKLSTVSNELGNKLQNSLQATFNIFDKELSEISVHLSGTISGIENTTERVPKVVALAYENMEKSFKEMNGQIQNMIQLHEDLQKQIEVVLESNQRKDNQTE